MTPYAFVYMKNLVDLVGYKKKKKGHAVGKRTMERDPGGVGGDKSEADMIKYIICTIKFSKNMF